MPLPMADNGPQDSRLRSRSRLQVKPEDFTVESREAWIRLNYNRQAGTSNQLAALQLCNIRNA